MSNIGYREIIDNGALSLKQLNDNLRAIWSKVMGDIEYRDLASDTREAIESRLTSEDLVGYSTAEQTAEAIRLEVGRVDESVAQLRLMADQVVSEVAAVGGDLSQVKQTASELTSAVSGLEGSVSQVKQTASTLQSSVSGLSGRVSRLEQDDTSVAIRLYDSSKSTSFDAVVGQAQTPLSSNVLYGLSMRYNGAQKGGMFANANYLMIAAEDLLLTTSAGALYFGTHPISGNYGMVCSLDLLPDAGNTYSLGGDGSGQRWKRLYTNNSVNTSDRRMKRDIQALDASDLLMKLRPVRYRMKEDGASAKLRFGFVAQEVARALKGTDYEDAELYYDENPDCLSLCYQELIAVLVEGYQRQSARIDALEQQLLPA